MPAQTGLSDAAIETLTGKTWLTVMVKGLEVAGFPVVHNSLEVITHVMSSPFTGEYWNVTLVPTTKPFIFH